MSGLLRCFLDRRHRAVSPEPIAGKKPAFAFRGEGSEPWMVDTVEYTIKRYAALGGMTYVGIATNADKARKLAAMPRNGDSAADRPGATTTRKSRPATCRTAPGNATPDVSRAYAGEPASRRRRSWSTRPQARSLRSRPSR